MTRLTHILSTWTHVDRANLTRLLIKAKDSKGVTYNQLAQQLSVNKVWLASVFQGQQSADIQLANRICSQLDIPRDNNIISQLTSIPLRGQQNLDNDPIVYRFNELIKVYGSSIRSIILEEFGDGIMSAIDCKIDINSKNGSNGQRILVNIDGKFLPYYKGSL